MIKEGARAKQVRKKQLLVAGAAGAIVLVLAMGAAMFVNNSAPTGQAAQAPAQPELKPIVTGGAAFNDKEAWRQQLSAEVAGLRKQMEDERSKAADETRRAVEGAVNKARAAPPVPPPAEPGATAQQGAGGSTAGAGSVFAPPLPPPPPVAGGQADGGAPPKPGRAGGAATGGAQQAPGNPLFQPPTGAAVPPPGGAAEGPRTTIGSVRFDEQSPGQQGAAAAGAVGGTAGGGAPAQAGLGTAGGEDSGGAADRRKAGSYIPAGTFVRIVVLNGLDAPTGGQAQQNPSPVLLKVLDSATLPNGYKANLSGCVLTGNGYGDVSSERSYIRLDRLTCVSEDGGAIDIAVKGYVAGEDGKSGMRGKLVSKTGQILANGLMAAIGSGIGQAFSSSATTTTTNPFGGQTATVNPGQQFQAGMGKGIGTAFEQLSKYYISLAEKTFPIIEIDGGRVTDVVFSRGFILEGR